LGSKKAEGRRKKEEGRWDKGEGRWEEKYWAIEIAFRQTKLARQGWEISGDFNRPFLAGVAKSARR